LILLSSLPIEGRGCRQKKEKGGGERKKRANLQEEEEEEGKKKVTVANKEKCTGVVSYQWRETLRENAAGMSANASGT
jgi:hypothetical protein